MLHLTAYGADFTLYAVERAVKCHVTYVLALFQLRQSVKRVIEQTLNAHFHLHITSKNRLVMHSRYMLYVSGTIVFSFVIFFI